MRATIQITSYYNSGKISRIVVFGVLCPDFWGWNFVTRAEQNA